MMNNTKPTCAVVFKAYGWDPFIERQARRLAEASGAMDFYVSLDETGGPAGPVPFERVIRFTCGELETLGLAMRSPVGGVLWWNPDYAHYQFLTQRPDYDYYLFVEYDCVAPSSLEDLVARAHAAQADLVAMPMRSDIQKWHWTPYQRTVYPSGRLGRALLCLSLYSSKALHLLYERRRAMAADASLLEWPNSELFVPTEIVRRGLKWLPLEDLVDCSRYVWFPPTLEEDLPQGIRRQVLHPVLDRRRYLNSMIDNRGSLEPGQLKKSLARFPRHEYAHILWKSARKGAIKSFRYQVKKQAGRSLRMVKTLASVCRPGERRETETVVDLGKYFDQVNEAPPIPKRA
jgi:hypothetical protein